MQPHNYHYLVEATRNYAESAINEYIDRAVFENKQEVWMSPPQNSRHLTDCPNVNVSKETKKVSLIIHSHATKRMSTNCTLPVIEFLSSDEVHVIPELLVIQTTIADI